MAMLIDKGIDAGNMNYILKIGIALHPCTSLVFGALSGKFAASAFSIGFAKNLRKRMFYNVQNFSFSNIDNLRIKYRNKTYNRYNERTKCLLMIVRIAVRGPIMIIFLAYYGVWYKS